MFTVLHGHGDGAIFSFSKVLNYRNIYIYMYYMQAYLLPSDMNT